MQKIKAGILLIVLTLGLSVSSQATNLVFSCLGQTPNGADAGYGGQTDMNGSDFLTGSQTVSLSSGTFLFGNTDDIDHVMTAGIFSDNAGQPGVRLGTFNTFTVPLSLDPGTTGYSNYTVSPTASILLSANTKYWVVVSVDQATDLPFPVLWRTTSSQTADTGSTSTTVSSTQIRYSADGGSTWSNAGAGNTMYSLSGTAVPEPSSACLLVGGLAGMIPLLRRFRQRKH